MYKMPELPYLFQDLEPYIDTHTLALHYNKHQKTYLNKLNEILRKNNYDYRYSLSELLYHINEFKKEDQNDILFNLGGVLNHNLYWKSMNKRNTKPYGKLKSHIDTKYGGYENLLKRIKEVALKQKGSGYTFLVLTNSFDLEIINTSNQDSPLLYGYIPLFTIDLWEHAYYINYENNKEEYLDNFFLIADFSNASEIFNNINLNIT